RMGRLLISMIAADSQHTLIGALETDAAGVAGGVAGELAGVGQLGVAVTTDYMKMARPDTVTLDFTNAAASVSHLEVAAANGAAIVVGSTGFSSELDARARQLAPRTRTVIAPNMSIGINVLMK